MYHEDELERTDPGSPVGDYLGIPINDDARLRADTWDGDIVSVLQHQCIPHSAIYAMRAPTGLKISTVNDPASGRIIAFIIDGTYTGPRTIWMDGRPHPSQFAPHTWAGFSTGVWEGDTLRIETTHIKSGYLRRNGIAFSDEAHADRISGPARQIPDADDHRGGSGLSDRAAGAHRELGLESLPGFYSDRRLWLVPAES